VKARRPRQLDLPEPEFRLETERTLTEAEKNALLQVWRLKTRTKRRDMKPASKPGYTTR
jgi:hypothetical protein